MGDRGGRKDKDKNKKQKVARDDAAAKAKSAKHAAPEPPKK